MGLSRASFRWVQSSILFMILVVFSSKEVINILPVFGWRLLGRGDNEVIMNKYI